MIFFNRFLFILVISFFVAIPASAAIVVNEVQIAPTEGRFLELHNTGSSDVNLTGWYIQRKTATGSSFGSLVTSPNFENKSIKGGGYFLISRVSLQNSDIVIDNLTLTESNAIRIRNSNGEDVDQIEWGSVGEGKSYQRMSGGAWIISSPTPRASNVADSGNTTTTNSPQETSTGNTSTMTSTTSTGSGSSFSVDPQIFTSAGEKKRMATVGGNTIFSGSVWGLKKEPIENARMLWNFGDGTTGEGKTVAHTYRYPGTYIITLDASSGYYSASDQVTVEAVSADIAISSVGDSQSLFVELYNKSHYELDLSFWSIRAGNLTFVIPEHTFIAAGAKIKFAREVTGLPAATGTAQAGIVSSSLASVALYYPNGTSADSYSPATFLTASPSPTTNTQPVIAKKTVEKQPLSGQENIKNTVLSQNTTTEKETPINNTQSASVANSYPETRSLFWWIMGVCVLVVVGIGGVFFTKRELSPERAKNEADSYEIIEESEDDKIPF